MFAQAMIDLRATLERLRPPVDVLSDIRELEQLSDGLVEHFRLAGEELGRFGVRRVVRVVGKSAQAAVHMQRLSKHIKKHGAHLAFSLAEAEQVFGK
jgi:hypothetical protein